MSLFKRDAHELEKKVRAAAVIEAAENWLGYKPEPGLMTSFGKDTGYNSHPWAGSFIDVVFKSVGVTIPSCVYTPAAMAEFIKRGQFFAAEEPELGDIAFMTFATGQESKFSMPHAGIVTATYAYDTTGMIGVIEGHTITGSTKAANKLQPGVFRRARGPHEIIGFGRPDYRIQNAPAPNVMPVLDIAYVRPGRRNDRIDLVQDALQMTVDLRRAFETRGFYGHETSMAYARWQRILGYVGADADGTADRASLTRLGEVTGLFALLPE